MKKLFCHRRVRLSTAFAMFFFAYSIFMLTSLVFEKDSLSDEKQSRQSSSKKTGAGLSGLNHDFKFKSRKSNRKDRMPQPPLDSDGLFGKKKPKGVHVDAALENMGRRGGDTMDRQPSSGNRKKSRGDAPAADKPLRINMADPSNENQQMDRELMAQMNRRLIYKENPRMEDIGIIRNGLQAETQRHLSKIQVLNSRLRDLSLKIQDHAWGGEHNHRSGKRNDQMQISMHQLSQLQRMLAEEQSSLSAIKFTGITDLETLAEKQRLVQEKDRLVADLESTLGQSIQNMQQTFNEHIQA